MRPTGQLCPCDSDGWAGCLNLGTFLDIYQVKRWDQETTTSNPVSCETETVNTLPDSDFCFDHHTWLNHGAVDIRAVKSWYFFFSVRETAFTCSKLVWTLDWFHLSMNVRIPALQLEALPLSKPLLVGRQICRREDPPWKSNCRLPT